MRILLVEDERAIRDLMSEWLRVEGYEVLHAEEGEAALDLARARAPDMLISDVFMPRMSGTDLCRAVRADPVLKDVYFILVTGMDGTDTQLEGFRAGADDFISKPLHREEFLARVQIADRVRRLQATVRELSERARVAEGRHAHAASMVVLQSQRWADVQRRLEGINLPALLETVSRSREEAERAREHEKGPLPPG